MKILTIGDIVSTNGVEKVKAILPGLKEEYDIDFVIANAENAAEGMGITKKIFQELQGLDIDVITMGNHTWGKKDIFEFVDNPKLLIPANYSKGVVGNGYGIYNCKDKKIAVIDLIGRAEMTVLSDNPFLKVEEIIEKVKEAADMIIVEFHAEATAEKVVMGHFLDGKAAIVYGTHTHIQTADETILDGKTAYITDIGMTGPKKSAIGMDIEVAIKRFLTSIPERYRTADGEIQFNACLFEFNDQNWVNKITRISL